MCRSLCALSVVALLAAGLALAQPLGGKRYAVLVGVDQYRHASLPALRFAEADAVALAGVLRAAGYQVTLLTASQPSDDRKPTRANIEARLREVLRACQPGDTVVVALAGHGVQFIGQADAYFCPADARPFRDEADTLVSLGKLYAELDKSFAGMKVLLVDACRNDPDAGRGGRSGVNADTAPRPPQGVAALFSCRAGERAFEHESIGHGVFFHHVIEALSGKAKDGDGEVTFAGLAAYVSRRVARDVPKIIGGGVRQSPNLKADYSTEPVLVTVRLGDEPKPARPAEQVRPADDKEIMLDLGGGQTMTMVRVPAGTFTMGSPQSEKGRDKDEVQHEVTISKTFYLGKYEVTRGQFSEFVAGARYKSEAEYYGMGGYGYTQEGKWERKPGYTWKNAGFPQADEHPVVNVSWNDAVKFCEWLSRKSGQAMRLPTEAEWEYACRAGTSTTYHSGDDPETLVRVGNAHRRDGFEYTAPVGSFHANRFGLFDMHGNVWEWCQDWYGDYQTSARADPAGAEQGSVRVVRGGGWSHTPHSCRSAYRSRYEPAIQSNYLGFRVCSRSAQ